MTDDQADAAAVLTDTAPENIYPDLIAFVTDWLAPTFARRWEATGERKWCARWWEHPEAVVRLTALWLAWEAARLAPGGMLSWLRDADTNLDRLTTAGGTFAQCAPTRHKPAPALLTELSAGLPHPIIPTTADGATPSPAPG